MAYSAEVLTDTPLAYWRLGDPSGTTISDSSGNSHTGTYAGSYTLGATGLISSDADTAVSASSGIGSIAAASWMNISGAVTLECWFKTSSSSTMGLVGRTNAGSFGSADSNVARIYIAAGQIIFQVFNSSFNLGFALQSPTSTYADNIRHHLVGTWDGTTGTLYIDGVQVATTTASFTLATSTTLAFYLGKMNASFPFSGTLDEVAFYNSGLNSTRVSAHFNAGIAGSPSSIIAESLYAETLALGSPSLVAESVYAETLGSGSPSLVGEAVYAETLAMGSPSLVGESVYLEALIPSVLSTGFTGWGIQL